MSFYAGSIMPFYPSFMNKCLGNVMIKRWGPSLNTVLLSDILSYVG